MIDENRTCYLEKLKNPPPREEHIDFECFHGGCATQEYIKNKYLEYDIDIRDISKFKKLNEIDYFIFVHNDFYEWWRYLVDKGFSKRLIYCAAESEVVCKEHRKSELIKISKCFPFLITWHESIVDNKRIFKSSCATINFKEEWDNILEFEDKNLLVNITANKGSTAKNELYSERRKCIFYFDRVHREEFALYGVGWDKEEVKQYFGITKSKHEVYHRFKFALCLENAVTVDGGITEKIFDCFQSGIVPIYGGVKSVRKYIPRTCYIDYFSFQNLDELYDFISKMKEETYNNYLEAISSFLKSSQKDYFTLDFHIKCIQEITKINTNFELNKLRIVNCKYKFLYKNIKLQLRIALVRKLKKIPIYSVIRKQMKKNY